MRPQEVVVEAIRGDLFGVIEHEGPSIAVIRLFSHLQRTEVGAASVPFACDASRVTLLPDPAMLVVAGWAEGVLCLSQEGATSWTRPDLRNLQSVQAVHIGGEWLIAARRDRSPCLLLRPSTGRTVREHRGVVSMTSTPTGGLLLRRRKDATLLDEAGQELWSGVAGPLVFFGPDGFVSGTYHDYQVHLPKEGRRVQLPHQENLVGVVGRGVVTRAEAVLRHRDPDGTVVQECELRGVSGQLHQLNQQTLVSSAGAVLEVGTGQLSWRWTREESDGGSGRG